MLPLEFILTDAHFVIALMAALACFATCWLYLDAWTGDRDTKDLLKWVGFGVLAIGMVVTATEVEPSFLGQTLLGNLDSLGMLLRLAGYAILAAGLAMDPLQPVPEIHLDEELQKEGIEDAPAPVAAVPAASEAKPVPVHAHHAAHHAKHKGHKHGHGFGAVILGGLNTLLPLAAGAVTYLYWRRAYPGLERHLKPVMRAFAWFTAFELVDLSTLARGTSDPRLQSVVAPFGPLWSLAHILLAVAAVILGLWVWQYLTKRVQTQLFMVITTACMVIFLVTTVSFTFLLMSRVQTQAFSSLETTAKVLNTSIAAQQAEAVSDAEVAAEDPAVAAAVTARDHTGLSAHLSNFLTTKKLSSLVITNESGQVLLRAEDPANWGDSLSSDTQVARALVGKGTSGLVSAEGTLAPRLVMRATTPLRDSQGLIVGTVAAAFTIDNAFVDGLQRTTGLASAMYSGPTRVATTLLSPDGTSRLVGVKETNTAVTNAVLTHGKTWSGLATIGSRSYLAVYAPLRDADNAPVGMLFVGEPQVLLLQAAGRSIELTFLIAVALLIVAVYPVHRISKSLAEQLH
ncbi:MAG TPA: cache domain-containing protein [Candidatus Saccharimonadia bacterium]|jgi:hypothetical protein|nr:cache domain-containing protein [Candidatus Saccharimonadia bacterium]